MNPTLVNWMLVLHVLAAIWLSAGGFAAAVVRAQAKRAKSLPERVMAMRIANRLASVFSLPGGILAGIFGEILDLDEDFMPFVVIAMMLGGVMQALHISHARHAKSLPARRAQLEFIADRLVMLASAPDATR